MTYKLGSLVQHWIEPVCRKTQLKVARSTPRTPPTITWKSIWRIA